MTNVTIPNSLIVTGYTLNIDVPIALTGTVTVATNSAISHSRNYTTQAYTLNLTVNGNLVVNGLIHAIGKGHRGGVDPVGPGTGGAASSHGGEGGCWGYTVVTEAISKVTYGSVTSPATFGSGAGSGDGGGAVKLTVASNTAVNGSISADTLRIGSYPQASGGSVWLTTRTLSGSGVVCADGGNPVAAHGPGGGGGRVAVYLTGSDDFGVVTYRAYGGGPKQGTADEGAPGTVYLQGASDAAGAGRVLVAGIYDTIVRTGLCTNTTPSAQWDLVRATVIVTNLGRLALGRGLGEGWLGHNWTVGNLSLVTANSLLDLRSNTLTINSRPHPLGSGAVTNYGQILWNPPEAGVLMLVR